MVHQAGEAAPRGRRRWITAIGALVSVAAIYYFVDRIRAQAGGTVLGGEPRALVAAFGVGLVGFGFGQILLIAAWHKVTVAFCGSGSLRAAARVYLLSQFAKYIPGNVGQYIGRFVLSREAGYPAAGILAATAFETVSVIWLALAVGSLVAFRAAGSVAGLMEKDAVRALGVAAIVVGMTVGLPMVLWVLTRIKHRIGALEHLGIPTWRTVVVCAGLYGGIFVCLAFVVMAIARIAYGTPIAEPATVLGVVAWGWLAGFLTPGAPAGVGVREVIYLAGLSDVYGESTALGVIVLFRMVTTAGDGVAFGVGLLLQRFGQPTGCIPEP